MIKLKSCITNKITTYICVYILTIRSFWHEYWRDFVPLNSTRILIGRYRSKLNIWATTEDSDSIGVGSLSSSFFLFFLTESPGAYWSRIWWRFYSTGSYYFLGWDFRKPKIYIMGICTIGPIKCSAYDISYVIKDKKKY